MKLSAILGILKLSLSICSVRRRPFYNMKGVNFTAFDDSQSRSHDSFFIV